MTRARRASPAFLAAVLVPALLAGCASIPSSSRPELINESIQASPPREDSDPRYDPIVPQPGEKPGTIVGDYLAVGGSFERQHARARAYLTAGAQTWNDESDVTVLEDAPYVDTQPDGDEVVVQAQQLGRVDPDGSYLPERAAYRHRFRLEKNAEGQWRITNPPKGVLITASTFAAAYKPYRVYFLDSTRTRVVPDVRWLAAPQEALASLLVSAIESGPSSWLGDAVRSDLAGARLQSNVVQYSDRVRVYLAGLADRTEALPPGGFAQLVWTLNQLGVGGVEVYADNQLVSPRVAPQQTLQRLNDWRVYDPDALSVSVPGYFVRDGAVWTTGDTPAPGPAGRGDYAATAVAVSTDQQAMAVIGSSRGSATLRVGRAPGVLRVALTGRSLTAPSWGGAVADEVWTVRDGKEVVLVPTAGLATRVVVPALDRLGRIRSLRLSRDGTRVALVAGGAGRERLFVGVVVRQDNAVTQVIRLRPLDVGEGPVTDASWSDALTLVALVRGGQQDSGLYTIRIDGVSSGLLVSTSGLPGPPAAIAAAPTLPLLTVAAGAVWRTPATNQPWTRVTRESPDSAAPAYPG